MQNIASGFLCYHPTSQRILLGLRSDTNSWANFGGGHEPKKDRLVKDTAIRELCEETGCNSGYKISAKPFDIYEDNFIRYYTYLATFDKLFAPILNQEHKNYGWFKIDNLPSNILPECETTMNKFIDKVNALSVSKISC